MHVCGCMCISFCVVQIIDIGSRFSPFEKKMEVFFSFGVWRQNKQSGGNVEIKQETKKAGGGREGVVRVYRA